MADETEKLNALLAYKDAHAPWFTLNENQPYALKRNLKLLGKLNNSPSLLPTELDGLTEKTITDTFSSYVKQANKKSALPSVPTTASQFFHSRMSHSPYFCDITTYSEPNQNNIQKASGVTLSTSKNSDLNMPAPTSEQVHGFALQKGEAFSSTRYFSDDKKSFAKIVVKNGKFTATHKNLNDAQKVDMALEMSYQFLLNIPSDKKDVYLTGSPEEVHRIHAALLYLQKEAGARFAHVTFHLPDGMANTADKGNDNYMKQHLGTFRNTPPQVIQWRDFLKIELKTSKSVNELPIESSQKKEVAPLIDMERIYKADDLSQHDKMHLNEYQRYLKEEWVGGFTKLKDTETIEDTKQMMAAHEKFRQQTEAAIHILKKAPSLEGECNLLKKLYLQIMETHQKTLEELHKLDSSYELQMKELMCQIPKARKKVMESCTQDICVFIDAVMTENPSLDDAQQKNLARHMQAMHEIASLICDKETLSDEILRSCGTQLLQALNCLESIKDYSKDPLFQKMKEFSKTQSEMPNEVVKTHSEDLLYASNQLKQRLNQFKSKLDTPAEPQIPLNPGLKEQLHALAKKIHPFIEEFEAEDIQTVLMGLHKQLNQAANSTTLGLTEKDSLIKKLDAALPYIKNNQELVQSCNDIKKQISPPSAPLSLPNEANEAPVLGK